MSGEPSADALVAGPIPVALDGTGAIFVQPHLDDVALSCGGAVSLADEQGLRPVIITLLSEGAAPGAPLSPLARKLHERWGIEDASQVYVVRRREDARAAAVLGAASWHLGGRDAIYRGAQYDSRETLFGAPGPGDATLTARFAAAIVRAWQRSARARIYLPLAVGEHVDHQLAFALAAPLVDAGADVWCYEDFPYVAREADALSRRVARLGAAPEIAVAAAPVLVDVTRLIERKLAAIDAYASQLPQLFQDEPCAVVLRRYAASVGAGSDGAERGTERCCERYWPLRART